MYSEYLLIVPICFYLYLVMVLNKMGEVEDAKHDAATDADKFID